ncbi:glycosyltransferase family 2 protein [Flavobacterium sp. XN-5]|uniref:glycosyltransferase family 2 protein n=1 Tax=Flavobacterium sp. XN-5 TaxID=2599390 RepID=UPI0011C88368|nr:glycosyltransferase [Flavobacterium sp. XN-5]NGY37420.1 glycosyltransferase family 2 protein [Flavobacterium sp. XN-5]
MKNNLAVIIPAYKSEFLRKTLESFKNQTCKDFVIYIGDDDSPYDIKSIVEEYENVLDIRYKKFDCNFGGNSLTKQWERCVELSNEKWVWLFSDDDIASPNAIKLFYETVNQNPLSHLFKFHTKMIDGIGQEINLFRDRTNKDYDLISPEHFINNRINNRRFRSYAVEYIMSRELYDKFKFVEFPLAWFSDDASWLRFSVENNGIVVIKEYIYWRFSGQNISSINNDETDLKKIEATTQYITWLIEFKNQHSLNILDEDILYAGIYQVDKYKKNSNDVKFNDFYDRIKLNFSKQNYIKVKVRIMLESIIEILKVRIKKLKYE